MKLRQIAAWPLGVSLCLFAGSGLAQQTKLSANDGKANDAFGYSAVVDGNTILVGAHQVDINGVADVGAAYVYVLNDTSWHQQAKLVATPYFTDDTLGGKVALKGDTAMLGAMRRDDKGKDSGAVVGFERIGSTWQQSRIFTAPDANPGDAFGQSIALTDQYLVIGAPRNDALGKDSGAAYIYQRHGAHWRYQTKIIASDGSAGDLFGISAAIDGDTIVIGADLNDERANNAGAVYVFVRQDEQWQQQAKLTSSDPGDTDIFGVRVAVSGDTALISARRDDVEGIGVDAGSAYIFQRTGQIWQQHMKLISPDGKADDRFGRGVALDGNTAIISAMHHDANGKDSGALYVYNKGKNGWQFNTKVLAEQGNPEDRFGWNVGLSGNTAVIATPNHDANGADSGAVFVQTLAPVQ